VEAAAKLPPRVVLFDGVCAVCDATVQFVLDRDPEGRFHFAPLQGPTAAEVFARHPEIPKGLDSILLVETDPSGVERVTWHSTAILRLCAGLGGAWGALGALRFVPALLRDPFYRAFAAIRYRVFGTLESCRIPKPEEASRFLD
jgi:predicted DCC family thiol-disulfide oxidoreductase YuxK